MAGIQQSLLRCKQGGPQDKEEEASIISCWLFRLWQRQPGRERGKSIFYKPLIKDLGGNEEATAQKGVCVHVAALVSTKKVHPSIHMATNITC